MQNDMRHLGPGLLAGIALVGGLGYAIIGCHSAGPAASRKANASADSATATIDRSHPRTPRPSRSRFFLPNTFAKNASDAGDSIVLLNDETTTNFLVEINETPETSTVDPITGLEITDADRHDHPARPEIGRPQRPELSTPENSDAGKPFHEWGHLTDDWGGLRPALDDKGIVLDADITLDWSVNFRGGASTNGSTFRHLLNINLTLDTQRLGLWHGGTFFFNFQNQNGANGSEDLGDIQGYSNIDSEGFTQLSELWYEQNLFEGALRIKLGKIDANGEFAFVEHGGEFLNSSFGFSPTIVGLTTYPDPSTGLVMFINPCESFYAGFGVFDGAAQEGVPTGKRGPSTFFGTPADLFLITELGARWTFGEHLPGRAAFGIAHHTGTFDTFDGGTDHGVTSFYFVLDQLLCRENPGDDEDEQGAGFFVQYGYADKDVSEIAHHVGFGLAWTGPIPSRDEDVAGVAYSRVCLSSEAGFESSHETVVEAFYKLQVTPFASVKADVQYIAQPGGGLTDAVVGTLRFEFVF